MDAAIDLRKTAFADVFEAAKVADHIGRARRLPLRVCPARAQLVAGGGSHDGQPGGRRSSGWSLVFWLPSKLRVQGGCEGVAHEAAAAARRKVDGRVVAMLQGRQTMGSGGGRGGLRRAGRCAVEVGGRVRGGGGDGRRLLRGRREPTCRAEGLSKAEMADRGWCGDRQAGSCDGAIRTGGVETRAALW